MIPTYSLDDDQWNMLVQDVAEHFDDVTLNRGFQYYKQGHVHNLTIPSDREVKAIVEGSEPYEVMLNLDFFTLNHCDCPVNGNCKHMVAVLLKYADLHHRSVHALMNAKSIVNLPKLAPFSKTKQIAVMKAENEAALKEQASRIPTMSVPEWREWFELCTAHLTQHAKNAQFVEDALRSIHRLRPVLMPVIGLFYTLHAQLFVLSKLTKQLHNQPNYLYSYLAYHTQDAVAELQDDIGKTIANGSNLVTEPDGVRLIEQTLVYLRVEMLTESNDNHYFLSHYQSIWSHWICPVADNILTYVEELQKLDFVADELGLSVSRFSLLIAQAGMRLYQSNDPEAWKLLDTAQRITTIPSAYLLYFLSYLAQTEQWDRLASWLVEIAPWLSLQRNPNIRAYSDFWDLAVLHHPDAEHIMWDTLASLLPASHSLYKEKLLASGNWERWMDYHLSIDSDPMDFRVTDLQPLEKNAPEVLLPFYHQAVERYVLIKNRDGYKLAVKLLKRLAKLYKKMKQEPRWEHFLESFASRNSRLRALQEELRKGKLLQ
jgi:hypothetical protein